MMVSALAFAYNGNRIPAIVCFTLAWVCLPLAVHRSKLFTGCSETRRRLYTAIIALVSGFFLVLCAWVVLPKKPSLSLDFMSFEKTPIMVIVKNESNVLADKFRLKIMVWNLGPQNPEPNSGGLGGSLDIVSFRRGELSGYVKPHDELEMGNLFESNPDFFHKLRVGDRLLGWGYIECAECEKPRGYWLYKIWGQPGWFAESKDSTDPEHQFKDTFSSIDNFLKIAKDPEKFLAGLSLEARQPMRALRRLSRASPRGSVIHGTFLVGANLNTNSRNRDSRLMLEFCN